MPTIDFSSIGDVMEYEFAEDTVSSVNSEDDTCVLSAVGSALLFYHCEANSTLRSNGAIEGAAAGFAVGESVIVMKNKADSSKKYVIGHTDGVKSCGQEYAVYNVIITSLSISIIVVWDIKNNCLAMGPVLSTDAIYVAWIAKTKPPTGGNNDIFVVEVVSSDPDNGPDNGASLWPILPQLYNTKAVGSGCTPLVCPGWDPINTCWTTIDEFVAAKHHPFGHSGDFHFYNNPESLIGDMLLPDSPVPVVCAIRTSYANVGGSTQTGWCEEGTPRQDETGHYVLQHVFYSMFGKMAQFDGHYDYKFLDPWGMRYHLSYEKRYIEPYGPPYDTPYYGSSIADKYSEKSVAMAVMLQFTPLVKTLVAPCYTATCQYDIAKEVREIYIHAATKYYENGTTGKDINEMENNPVLVAALETATGMAYSGRPDYEIRDLYIGVNIVKGPKIP